MKLASRKRRPGRPAKVTLAQIEQIGQDIALGLTEEQACVRQRVNLNSFRTAKRRNPAFESVIQIARADFAYQALKDIREGKRGWQGAAWILERRHQPQFARAYVAVPQDPTAAVTVNQLSPEIEQGAREIFAREFSGSGTGKRDTGENGDTGEERGGSATP